MFRLTCHNPHIEEFKRKEQLTFIMRNTPHYYEFLIEKEKLLANNLGWSPKITFSAIFLLMITLFLLIIKWVS